MTRASTSALLNNTGRVVRQPLAWLPLLALSIWDLNDASGPQAVPDASLMLGVVAACLLFAVLLRRDRPIDVSGTPIFLTALAIVVGLAMVAFRTDQNVSAIASDVGTLCFFLLCLTIASAWLPELLSSRTVHWFAVIYVGIALVAWFAATTNLRPAYWYGGRWDPPYYMLLGALGLIVRHHRSLAIRLAAFAALGLMSLLGLESGNRTQFLLGMLFVLLAWASNRRAVYLVVTGFVAYLLLVETGVMHGNQLSRLLAESRFSLVEAGLDASLLGRIDELHDIWLNITQFDSWAQMFFGRGLGAGWLPITRPRLIPSADGYVYYVHVGFASLGYRLGFLGLVMFFYWQWMALKSVRRLFDPTVGMGARFWYLGGIGFALNYFLQNSLFDPPAVLAMSVLIVLEHERRKHQTPKPPSEPSMNKSELHRQ